MRKDVKGIDSSITFNRDCLEVMREYPDNYFDLLVADPPYGHAEGQPEHELRNTRGRYARYASSQFTECSSRERERERERESKQSKDSVGGLTAINRTGGTWAAKFAKKSLRGTKPRMRNISTKCSASHATKSFGAGITSACRRRAAFWSGTSGVFPKNSVWQCANTHGQVFSKTQSCFRSPRKANRDGFTRRKSPLSFTRGFSSTLQSPVTRF